MSRRSLPALAVLATLLAGAGPTPDAEALAQRPKPKPMRPKVERREFGGELVLSGGPSFVLARSARDQLDPHGEVRVDYGLGFAAEGHLLIDHRASLYLRLGFAVRRETWDPPVDDRGVVELGMLSSRVHLFHVGARLRPFLKRVTPSLFLGVGPDLVVHRAEYGGYTFDDRLPGLGVQAGFGLDVFINTKVAVHAELRNALSVHAEAERELVHDEPLGGGQVETTPAYALRYRAFEDALDLSFGVTLRFR